MSSDQGPKKGKGRGRNRRRRGNQPRQSESVPGGLQQPSGQEREGATALSASQPSQQPPQQPQRPPQQPQIPAQQPQRPAQQTQRPPQQPQIPAQQPQRPAQQTQRPPQQTQRPPQQTQRPAQQTQRPPQQPQPPPQQPQPPPQQPQPPPQQPQPQLPQTPPQQPQGPQTPPHSQQAQAVSHHEQERIPSAQKKGKSKQQRKKQQKSHIASPKPTDESSAGPSGRQGDVKTTPPQTKTDTIPPTTQPIPEPSQPTTSTTTPKPSTQQPHPTTSTTKPQTPVEQPPPTTTTTKPQTPVEQPPPTTTTKPQSSPQQQPTATAAKPKATTPQPTTPQPTRTSQPPPQSIKAELRPPRRPDGGGKSGRPIRLRVNFLPVQLPQEDIHHYDAEIKAKGQKKGDGYTSREAPRIIQEIVKQYEKTNPRGPKLVYDKNGKNIYCRTPIPGIEKDRREFKVLFTTDNGKEREYTVEVKWVSQVSLYNLNQALEGKLTEIPLDTLQAVEVVLRHLPSMSSIPVGPSFYSYPDGHEKDLGQGLQVWNGTFVSIRPTQWKMMLNVDTCSTAFYKEQPVLHFMCESLYLRTIPARLNDKQQRMFGKEMKTIKIETTHLKRRQKVSGLSRNSAKNEFFDCDGKKTSVLEYFKKTYDITLKYPDLPCIKLGQKGNCIPIELCNIVQGQRKQGRLTAKQTSEMIRYTALPAPDRQQKISELIRKAKYDQDAYCRDFGIKVGQEMVQIRGRVLDPPVINYGQNDKTTPRDGAWNMPKKPMYEPKELKEWAIVSYQDPNAFIEVKKFRDRVRKFLDDNGLDNFINKFVQAGRNKALRINPSPCYRAIPRGGHEGIGNLFHQLHEKYPNLQLIMAILPGKDNEIYYEEVKHYGDVVYGIRTQCLKVDNAVAFDDFNDHREMETLINICLKVNAKLGGTTFIVDKGIRSPILRRPVIIFGADVTHPSPRDTTTPSIAAVVASMDSHPNLYSAEVRVQKHRQEMIAELKDMVKILLRKFRSATGAQPEKILFYRDGVSEGQFKDVLIHELQAIQHACLELHQNFKPGITFIVVQKRHHTRFFAEDPKDRRGKSQNIPAGTVVDTQVCHPFEFDWYLCSHAGIQGTSKPAHYHVLYDDSNFKSDELQILTNQLCHTYVRCARSVSIPAAAYYAHHVAFRARYHLSEVDRGSSDGSVASGENGVSLDLEEMKKAIKVHGKIDSSMYFA